MYILRKDNKAFSMVTCGALGRGEAIWTTWPPTNSAVVTVWPAKIAFIQTAANIEKNFGVVLDGELSELLPR